MISKQGLSRRRTAGATLAIIMLGVSLLVVANIQPAAATTTYNQYTVWGENSVHVGFETTITGMVGARHDRPGSPNGSQALTVGGGGSVINGDVRVGDDTNPKGNVQLGNYSKINGTIYYANALHATPSAKYTAAVHGPADLPASPIPVKWPAPGPAAKCAQAPETFPTGTKTFNLTAGHQYGLIKATAGATLNFNGAGDYYIAAIKLSSLHLHYNAGAGNVNVFVCGGVFGATILSNTGAVNANHVYWEVNGTPTTSGATGNIFEFSNGPWIGDVVAPHGGIHYGSGGSGSASMSGHFWAEHIDLEHGIQVSTPPPDPGPTTTTAPTTTTTGPTTTTTGPTTTTSTTSTSTTTSSTTTSTSTTTTTIHT